MTMGPVLKYSIEDERDAEVAQARLAEIAANPDSLVTGPALEERLSQFEAPAIPHPALRWRGGKWMLRKWVVEHFPRHETYVELCAGAASVLMAKPISPFECINDLDDEVVCFWKIMRERTEELKRAILLTPFSRAELATCQEPVEGEGPVAELERARRLVVRCYQGRGSSARRSGWRFQPASVYKGVRWKADVVRAFYRVAHLDLIALRLRYVQIEKKHAADIISGSRKGAHGWDGADVLFYFDPPYHDGRGHSKNLYSHEMNEMEHRAIAAQLHNIEGMAVVSGYHGLYDELYRDWPRVERRHYGERVKATTEVLWIHPRAWERLGKSNNSLTQRGEEAKR